MKTNSIKVTMTSNELSENTKEEMWGVYHNYYHYSREYFMNRINQNNYFSFYTVDGKIVGFTGLRINRTEVADRECLLIYFGQTIVDKAYRGNGLMQRTAVKLCVQYWKDLILGRVYIWADSLTYKAYLNFAKTVSEYYPSYRTVTPSHVQQLINFVGDEYYGPAFCNQTGTVRKDTVFVNDPTTAIDPNRERDLDVLFYLAVNPNYVVGHGLLTITPMHPRNYLLTLLKCTRKIFFGKKKEEKRKWILQAE